MSDIWPKTLPALTEEQQQIREVFYQMWLEELPKRYSVIEWFNHRYARRMINDQKPKVLDIGAGRGTHLGYEHPEKQEYIALELRPELAQVITSAYPAAKVVIGDIQKHIDLPDGYFDRILAIHVLEHLPDLPKALDEIKRLLNKDGYFTVLIPCDPGFAYSIARNISARRMFEKRFHQSYDWFIACEHINPPQQIIEELKQRFVITHQTYFPLLLPSIPMNLVIGLTLTHV